MAQMERGETQEEKRGDKEDVLHSNGGGVPCWNRLPRQVMVASSLELFKARLDGALSSLVLWEMSVLMAGSLTWMATEGPFQLRLFCDSGKSH